MIHFEDVDRVLKTAPDGMTTAEIASRLGVAPDKLSGRLSKLADYGRIDREFRRRVDKGAGPPRWSVWRARYRLIDKWIQEQADANGGPR